MLHRCIGSLFREPRKPKALKDASFSIGNSLNSRELCVRIVHAGGREDLYQNPVVVSQLMNKYPEMSIAWPEVFKNPHESVLSANELLVPGQKYYLVPVTTLKKLKKKHSTKKNKSMCKKGLPVAPDESDESISARDYYVSNERRSRRLVKKHVRSNHHVPPVVRSKSCRGSDWEPSLTSIQELSP